MSLSDVRIYNIYDNPVYKLWDTMKVQEQVNEILNNCETKEDRIAVAAAIRSLVKLDLFGEYLLNRGEDLTIHVCQR